MLSSIHNLCLQLGIWGFPLVTNQLVESLAVIFIYKSPRCVVPSFNSIGPSVQEKSWKIDFQDNRHGGHLGLPIGMILAVFELQVTLMLPTKFQVSWPNGSGEEAKIACRHLGFPIGTFLAFFIYRSPRCFLPSFKSIGSSVQKLKRPSWISDWNALSCFDLQVTPMLSSKFQVNWLFRFRRRSEK